MNVQGWIADDPSEGEFDSYETIACTICTRVHLVNPNTGKVLGNEDIKWPQSSRLTEFAASESLSRYGSTTIGSLAMLAAIRRASSFRLLADVIAVTPYTILQRVQPACAVLNDARLSEVVDDLWRHS